MSKHVMIFQDYHYYCYYCIDIVMCLERPTCFSFIDSLLNHKGVWLCCGIYVDSALPVWPPRRQTSWVCLLACISFGVSRNIPSSTPRFNQTNLMTLQWIWLLEVEVYITAQAVVCHTCYTCHPMLIPPVSKEKQAAYVMHFRLDWCPAGGGSTRSNRVSVMSQNLQHVTAMGVINVLRMFRNRSVFQQV